MSVRTSSPVITKWICEYCAPVVVTLTTLEAENVCLKNGLLFHELLSSFGHLDGINTTIRSGNQNFYFPDAHIRFESSTEIRVKETQTVEELLVQQFKEFDISRIPNNVPELKASPPSGWSYELEQTFTRSLSFTESEMLSHPTLLLTVVSTSDFDPIASMQELASGHHTPACLSSGQYDSSIPRVYLLIHDATDKRGIDPLPILRRLQAKFSSVLTRLMVINSLSVENQNVHQPDMWSRFLTPRYYPHFSPSIDSSIELPRNPLSGAPVLGARLSMEDFMTMREFCILLFNQDIVPWMERKIAFLNKAVNDSRKGVKNVLKSFWRKPKDDSEVPIGSVRYRYDKIESQTLLLADLSFMIRDYDTAVTMYKLVRDDFKADKSNMHLAHTSLMLTLCQMLLEPGKSKDLYSNLEALSQVLTTIVDVPHANALYALMMAEVFICNQSLRSTVDAAKVLLQAASTMTKYPLMCGLFTERVGLYYLQMGQVRKFVFHEVFAGNKIYRCGRRAANHTAVCFSSAMLCLDGGTWGDLKIKLNRALARDFKLLGKDGAQRSLLLMIRLLSALLNNDNEVGKSIKSVDIVSVYKEIVSNGPWGSLRVENTWPKYNTRELLLANLPITAAPGEEAVDLYVQKSDVCNFGVPELIPEYVCLVRSLNGRLDAFRDDSTGAKLKTSKPEQHKVGNFELVDEMYAMCELEKQWLSEQVANTDIDSSSGAAYRSLVDKWAEVEGDIDRSRATKNHGQPSEGLVRIALGEDIQVSIVLTNKMPIDLSLSNLKVNLIPIEGSPELSSVDENSIAVPCAINVGLGANTNSKIVLSARPVHVGLFELTTAQWNLSEFMCVQQSLKKPGFLLQKTLKQRLQRERGEDRSLRFEVVPPHPLLHVSFEGLSAEVLQGQLLRTTLILKNEGAAPACEIFIKLSQPSFVLLGPSNKLLQSSGLSSTLIKLDDDYVIQPGEQVKFDAWLRITKVGLQKISLLVSYMALRDDGTREFFGPGKKCRTSFLSIETRGLPSVTGSVKFLPKSSSNSQFNLLTRISNNMSSLDSFIHANGGFRDSDDEEDEGFDGVGIHDHPRISSMGQMDIPSIVDTYLDVDDNFFQVAAAWMLGSVVPYKNVSASKLTNPVGPADVTTACFPVILADELKKKQGSCSWLFSFEEFNKMAMETAAKYPIRQKKLAASEGEGPARDGGELELYEQLKIIAEQFLCIDAAREQFERDVQESKDLLDLAASEAENIGPRTIAQVRRDRQKALAAQSANESSKSSAVNANTIKAEEGLTDSEDYYSSSLPPQLRQDYSSVDSQAPVDSIDTYLSPKTVKNIADKEAQMWNVAVAFVWLCRWQGKIRWGMESVRHIPVRNSDKKNAMGDAINLISVGIDYPRKISLSSRVIGHEYLRVTVKIRSLDDTAIYVNMEALGTHQLHTVSSTQQSSVPVKDNLLWVGATKYSDVLLSPRGEVSLPFTLLLTQPGLHDINSLRKGSGALAFAFAGSVQENRRSVFPSSTGVAGHALSKTSLISSDQIHYRPTYSFFMALLISISNL